MMSRSRSQGTEVTIVTGAFYNGVLMETIGISVMVSIVFLAGHRAKNKCNVREKPIRSARVINNRRAHLNPALALSNQSSSCDLMRHQRKVCYPRSLTCRVLVSLKEEQACRNCCSLMPTSCM